MGLNSGVGPHHTSHEDGSADEINATGLTGAGGALRVKEIDGTPNVSPVTEIQVTNGTLTDNGGGSVTITISGGASQFDEVGTDYRLKTAFHAIAEHDAGDGRAAIITLQNGSVDIFSDNGSGHQGEFALVSGAVFAFAYDGTHYAQLDMLAGTTHGFAFSVDVGTFVFDGGPIKLPLLSADPSSPVEGWIYGNTTTHKARYYDGTAWQNLF